MSRVPCSAARAVPFVLVVLGMSFAPLAHAATAVGSINFTLGPKKMSTDWYLGPPVVDASGDTLAPGKPNQPAMGVELTWGHAGWPVLLAFDVMHSFDDGINRIPRFFTVPPVNLRRRASTLEIGFGLRRAWEVKRLTPYLGAGGSWVHANGVVETSEPLSGQFGTPDSTTSFHSSKFGFWVGGGMYRRLGPRFQIGLTGRYSKAKLPATTIVKGSGDSRVVVGKTTPLEAGGTRIGLVVGWSFPSRK